MRILFFGSGEFGIPTLRALAEGHELAGVVTQPARPSGRGLEARPTPIAEQARELGLPVWEVEDVNDPEVIARLLELRPELGVVVAFGQKIGPPLLEGIRGGCVNLHASLLPKYRGAAPIHWAVLAGEEKTGVTLFKLTPRMDAGPILAQRWTYIKPEETTAELHERLARIAPDAMAAGLELYAADPNPPGEPQDERLASKAPKLKKSDGLIHFDRDAVSVARHICAMWSWPGARCRFESADQRIREDVILARARAYEGAPAQDMTPGRIDDRWLVATGRGMLEILELKPAGSRLMTWPDFVNGRRVRAGDHFNPAAGAAGA